jgi:hypothetical protein
MTVPGANVVRILGGTGGEDPTGRPAGVDVDLEVLQPGAVAAADPAAGVPVPRRTAFRAAPLLAILDTGAGRLIVVGQCQVTAAAQRAPVVRVLAQALWLASREDDAPRGRRSRAGGGAARFRPADHGWRMVPGYDGLRELLIPWLRDNPHPVPADREGRATVIAKAITESSRNETYTVRELRYELERTIGASLRRLKTQELESVLADVVELTVAVSRARDAATEARRGGLSSWRSDPAAYHAQRRLQDPTLPRRPGARKARRRSWFPILDAGVRQCEAMDRLLAEESTLLHQLLDAAASVSVARDAQAQETFTLVATVGGVLIGIPALIIALYGATSVLPINTSNLIVLVPVAVSGLLAAVLAAFLPGRERIGKAGRFTMTLIATVATIALLAIAGALVTPKG